MPTEGWPEIQEQMQTAVAEWKPLQLEAVEMLQPTETLIQP